MQAKRYWIQTSIIAFVAAIFGIACYVTAGIIVARGEMNASGAHHQVTVSANVACDCIIEFQPVLPMAGSGTYANPFITYVSYVDVLVGFSGVGFISIEDEFGNEVWAYDQTSDDYQEYTVTLDLLHGIGLYHFTILVDGVIAVGPLALPVMYIDYRQLPVPPEPPTTGRGPIVYVGGYAASALGILGAGAISAGLAFLIAFLIALGKKKREEDEEKADKATGKKMSRTISPKSINTAGVAAKKPVRKAQPKKKSIRK